MAERKTRWSIGRRAQRQVFVDVLDEPGQVWLHFSAPSGVSASLVLSEADAVKVAAMLREAVGALREPTSIAQRARLKQREA